MNSYNLSEIFKPRTEQRLTMFMTLSCIVTSQMNRKITDIVFEQNVGLMLQQIPDRNSIVLPIVAVILFYTIY